MASIFKDPGGWFKDTVSWSARGGVLSPVIDSLTGADQTEAAIQAQKEAAAQAGQVQLEMFNQQREDYAPWRETGTRALAGLESGDFADNLEMDPGYQFRMNEGMKAINAGASARGNRNSGATMKALTRFGQDYASNEYDKAYNRQYNRLSQLAGFGGNATNASANAAGQYGQNMANNYIGMGNAIGAANIAQANRQSQLYGQGMTALAFSDERLKSDIKQISNEDIKEFKQAIKPYRFKYIDEKYGRGEWAGVMAQDLEKSKLGNLIVVEDLDGNKMIDTKKAVSLMLAIMAEGE